MQQESVLQILKAERVISLYVIVQLSDHLKKGGFFIV